MELIIGIWLGPTRNRLAKTYLTALTKVWNYEAVGVGSALANFIIKRFYGGRVTVAQAVFIATQLLMHVKDNAPACGGQSKVIAMFKRGDVGFIRAETLRDHERFLEAFDDAIAPTCFGGSDPTVSNQDFTKRVDALAARLKSLRNVELIEQQAEQVSKDVRVATPKGEITIVGDSIKAAIAAGDVQPTLSETPKPARPVRSRSRIPRKRGRKGQPPSQG